MKQRFSKEYLDYIQFTRESEWDWEFIHTYLKITEGKVQFYYDEYSQEEFDEKLSSDENFIKRWGHS